MRKVDLTNIEEAGTYKSIKAGVHKLKIKSVEDIEDKEQLKMVVVNEEGVEFNKTQSYSDSAKSFFKGLITSLKNNNRGFVWDDDKENDEQNMVGKIVYGEFRLEETNYNCEPGQVKTKISLNLWRSNASSDIPDVKLLNGTFMSYDDYEEKQFERNNNNPFSDFGSTVSIDDNILD